MKKDKRRYIIGNMFINNGACIATDDLKGHIVQ